MSATNRVILISLGVILALTTFIYTGKKYLSVFNKTSLFKTTYDGPILSLPQALDKVKRGHSEEACHSITVLYPKMEPISRYRVHITFLLEILHGGKENAEYLSTCAQELFTANEKDFYTNVYTAALTYQRGEYQQGLDAIHAIPSSLPLVNFIFGSMIYDSLKNEIKTTYDKNDMVDAYTDFLSKAKPAHAGFLDAIDNLYEHDQDSTIIKLLEPLAKKEGGLYTGDSITTSNLYFYLCSAQINAHKSEAAIANCLSAVYYYPDSYNSYNHLAIAYENSWDFDNAYKAIKEAKAAEERLQIYPPKDYIEKNFKRIQQKYKDGGVLLYSSDWEK